MRKRRKKLDLPKKAVSVSVCIIMAALIAQFGHATDESGDAKELLSKAVKAIGGEKKACGWTTRVDKGKLTSIRPGWGTLHANCTQHIKKPDKLKIDQDFSAYDHPFFMVYYYNGGEAWLMVNLGVRQHPYYTKQLGKHMRTIDGPAYYLTECDTFFIVPDVPEDSLVTAADVHRVGVVDNGDTVLFDLDKKTFLPVRRIEENRTTHVLLDDYRKTGGVNMPYHVTMYQGGILVAEYHWDEIKFNEKIDDAIFEEHRPEPKESPE
ncbi:MAG: hypothetical protein GTO42_08600 [Candidatus Latescibacteria bacterium]|nr:hypothetical protein [Candidatus Latescibacterota bacterium]NIO29019.1 hypothetical protein [Candidatus Latescibacterota bacterium]NIO56644.1 hypothetical protein [Candidatus Latescibacterota bacterium]NIT02227.1 hypothetical protein [Candidatus Latescibacterota bacterium]NIT39112.1 hypothetical protein [Candidatus Latescibacterota bacterium]